MEPDPDQLPAPSSSNQDTVKLEPESMVSMEPDPNQLPAPSSLNQDTVKLEPESMRSIPSLAPDRQSWVSNLSRYVEGIEIVDTDLDCLRNTGSRVTGTIMNAYASLVPDKDSSLTLAGCIILSSFVPNLIRGETSCNTTLEKSVPVRSKSKMLASRRWAFPLCGGSPPHWVLGWVDWSTHEIGFFDSLGTNHKWADQYLCQAAAGVEHWIKYHQYPDIKSLNDRFKDWTRQHHAPPRNQRQRDNWSCGYFVMMAMHRLSNLDFSLIRRDKLNTTRLSALRIIENVRLVVVPLRRRKRLMRLNEEKLAPQEPPTSSSILRHNVISRAPEGGEVQKIIDTILNAKRLVVFCGLGVSVLPGLSGSSLGDLLGLLCPIIWQDRAQSSPVFQTMLHHLNNPCVGNQFYPAMHALDRRGNLLRVYTHNINVMEKTAGLLTFGVPSVDQIGQPDCPRCIPLLGRLDQMSCTLCCKVASTTRFLDQSASNGLPVCVHCEARGCVGHHGIWRPKIAVCKEEHPDLNLVITHDEKQVDVVLAVGVRHVPDDNLPDIVMKLSQAAQSRAQDGALSSIMIDLEVPALERPGIQDLFQICLQLDPQHLFARVVEAAHKAAAHDPHSNTMLIHKTVAHMGLPISEGEERNEEALLLSLPPWYFPSP